MNPTDPKGAIGATKNPLHLIPTVAMTAEAAALKCGLEKYGAWNWRESGIHATTYCGAILRHLLAWRDGEDIDPDSGVSHLGHIRANCAILLDAAHVDKLVDDRPKDPNRCRATIPPSDEPPYTEEELVNAVPEHTPPPAPEGMKWEYRGMGWTNSDRKAAFYCIKTDGSNERHLFLCGGYTPGGTKNMHYFEAVPQIPEGLPPLPPVPENYSRWEYRGTGWHVENPSKEMIWLTMRVGDSMWSKPHTWLDGRPAGCSEHHYIEAVK